MAVSRQQPRATLGCGHGQARTRLISDSFVSHVIEVQAEILQEQHTFSLHFEAGVKKRTLTASPDDPVREADVSSFRRSRGVGTRMTFVEQSTTCGPE